METLLPLGLLIFLGLLLVPSPGRAECNVCSVFNNLACVSETEFQTCSQNSLPIGPINSCPTGYVCSSANASICQPNLPDAVPACTDCNTCDDSNTFACTGLRTFALCLGLGIPSDIVGSCAPFHVCNKNYPQICGNATMGIVATCPSTSETTSTTAPTSSPSTSDPVTYCRTIRQNGLFPVGSNILTTCRQYIYCFIRNNIWSGSLYTCPGNTYFNSATRYCHRSIPKRCYGTVQSLSAFGIELY